MTAQEEDKQNRGAEWIGIGLSFGTGIGVIVGMFVDSVAIGISMGAGLGIVFGALMMSFIQRQDRNDESDEPTL